MIGQAFARNQERRLARPPAASSPRAAGPPWKRKTGGRGRRSCGPGGSGHIAATFPPRTRDRGRRALAPSLPVRSVRHFRLLDAAPAVRAISRLLAPRYLAATAWPKSSANTALALPVCLTAFAASRLTGWPTSIRAIAHSVVRRTLDAVDAFLIERYREDLVELALEGLGAFREHAFDRFHVVALVGRHLANGVAGGGADEVGLEHHRTLLALVQHRDLDFGRASRAHGRDGRA